MIITQKYHSSQEIDPEFIDSLEDLMSEHVPSFEWIKIKEKLSPENFHYSYYLFFGKTKNSPIGYAQVLIKNEDAPKERKKLFFKSISKPKKVKEVTWCSPSSSEEGVIFDPAFLKGGLAKTAEIAAEYNKREEVKHQELMLGDEVFGNVKLLQAPEHGRESIVNCLVKNRSNYQEYLSSLAPETQEEVKGLWKKVYKDQSYKVGEYSTFKDCFSYKSKGASQYKAFRKDTELAPYISQANSVLTFESADEVFAFVFIFEGSPGQVFFKTHSLDNGVNESLLIQAAIMYFYDNEEASKLRFLERRSFTEELAKWGFTHKSVHIVEITNQ